MELILKEGIQKTVEITKIPYINLIRWFLQYKKDNQIPMRSHYSQKEKDALIQQAYKIGVKKAAEEADIPFNTATDWFIKDKKTKGLKVEKRRHYSQEEKNKIIELARGKVITTIAKELGINPHTLSNWIYKDSKRRGIPIQTQSRYFQEQREETIELALRVGIKKANERTLIPKDTLRGWLNQVYKEVRASQSEKLLSYTSEQKEEAIKLVMEGERIRIVAEELNVPFDTLVSDVRKYEHEKEQIEFLDTFEAEVLKAVEDGYTIKDIAKDFSVNRKLVARWIQERQKQQTEELSTEELE